MLKTIQQEAFLFSHEITKRLPHVADRLKELMIIDPKDLLATATLNECISLLRSDTGLLETFGRLFLPENAALEVWTNSKGESYAMFVKGATLIRLGRLVRGSTAAGQQDTIEAEAASAALAKNMRESPAAAAAQNSSRRSVNVFEEEDDSDKKLAALPSIPSRRKSSPASDRPIPKKRRVDVSEDDGDGILQRPRPSNKKLRRQMQRPSKKNQVAVTPKRATDIAHAQSEEKDCSAEENIENNDEDQKSVASVDKLPNNVPSSSAATAITTEVRTVATGRGRGEFSPLKSGQTVSMAQPFIRGLVRSALNSISREANISFQGPKIELINRLIQKLAIDPEMPFSQLPVYVQKYDKSSAHQPTCFNKSMIRGLHLLGLKSLCHEAKLPTSGKRPEVLVRLFEMFAIDPEMIRLAFEKLR